jgi:hypothetical protein
MKPNPASASAEIAPRRDRTQEVAGSSPASSMENRGKLAVFFGTERIANFQALDPSDALRCAQMTAQLVRGGDDATWWRVGANLKTARVRPSS